MDAPEPLTPVERLLVLADLYTQHNDRIDLLLTGSVPPDTDAYAASARRLEREAHHCVKTVRRQRLSPIEPVTSAVLRLTQIAYLTGGATRYLATAQQALPTQDAQHAYPDHRRGFGPYVRMARDLTALAPTAIVDAALAIAGRLPASARGNTTPVGIDRAQHGALLDVARGNVTVIERDQHAWGHTMTADNDLLRHLEDHQLVTRKAASAPPPFARAPLRARVQLTALGIAALSAAIDTRHLAPPAAAPAPAPAAAPTTRARR
ncbi:hypothetical protein ACWEL8_09755 [Streptomyces sp. NPDC004690]